MKEQANKKLALLFILDILQKYSSDIHKLTQDDIRKILLDKYGIEIERRAIGRNIQLLKEAGFDIDSNHATGAHIIERKFTDSELRVLIDGVLFSPYIKARYAKDLIAKLGEFGSVDFDDSVLADEAIDETFHERNADFFDTIDKLVGAIKNKRQVMFSYTEYDYAPDKNASELFTRQKIFYDISVNPYRLIVHGGKYYLLGSYDGEAEISSFRVDGIVGLMVTDTPSCDIENSELNGKPISDYIFAHPYMLCGKTESVQIKVSTFAIDNVVDAFGKNIRICTHDRMSFRVTVSAGINDVIEWAVRMGSMAEIISPEYVRQAVKDRITEMAEAYGIIPQSESSTSTECAAYPYNLLTMIFGSGHVFSDDKKQIAAVTDSLINELSTSQKAVMRKIYAEGLSREKSADDLGITMEKLVLNEAGALRDLRHPSRSYVLSKFISHDKSELIEEIMTAAIDHGTISMSWIQRTFGLGYATAACIVDELEELGYISESNGIHPRRILVTRDELLKT